ncbi:MAG TPA: MOSC domain-containing protein [Egibacteraceae bacterium]|nr:MOSC domain-containing protein [Egibacteraceae bacterium]
MTNLLGVAVTGSPTVAGIFANDGGVPKLPVPSAEVGLRGLVGDRQRMRKYHGGPLQALCLWSAEVVAALQAEGHPVFPGACGENLSLAGLDWSFLEAGARLRIGTVLAELTLPTTPCKQIRPYFADGAIRRVHHDRYPGWSRWYASVVEPGRIALGDRVAIEVPA